ncbi:MAG: hypothetical protein U0264_06090 [Candidatus Kapaibacterium sp.]
MGRRGVPEIVSGREGEYTSYNASDVRWEFLHKSEVNMRRSTAKQILARGVRDGSKLRRAETGTGYAGKFATIPEAVYLPR